MSRQVALHTETMWSGTVDTAAGAVTGWHHHGDHDTTLYIVSGRMRLESGPGRRARRRGRAGRLPARARRRRAPRVQPGRRDLPRGHRALRFGHADGQRRRPGAGDGLSRAPLAARHRHGPRRRAGTVTPTSTPGRSGRHRSQRRTPGPCSNRRRVRHETTRSRRLSTTGSTPIPAGTDPAPRRIAPGLRGVVVGPVGVQVPVRGARGRRGGDGVDLAGARGPVHADPRPLRAARPGRLPHRPDDHGAGPLVLGYGPVARFALSRLVRAAGQPADARPRAVSVETRGTPAGGDDLVQRVVGVAARVERSDLPIRPQQAYAVRRRRADHQRLRVGLRMAQRDVLAVERADVDRLDRGRCGWSARRRRARRPLRARHCRPASPRRGRRRPARRHTPVALAGGARPARRAAVGPLSSLVSDDVDGREAQQHGHVGALRRGVGAGVEAREVGPTGAAPRRRQRRPSPGRGTRGGATRPTRAPRVGRRGPGARRCSR